ncbi:hypothetical protein MSP8887_03023 [Marinomonas spartinae]|uniref:Uncharacterized protein n=1 Tax=Marinomonas spartinae TaxID=1792290 RepID=A0A1A8TM41_9GAMM|nr:hypothetical protein [Marinomonas spartinae]SBS34149.1 hypothetical protein MSP8886_02977 [Marinomonas spartinae]SBS37723.1 hypothetical protein MSP8887_03023 [Marinomonas spartinae]
MKKVFFKKLQSLTAILVLNTMPVSYTQASTVFSTQPVSSGVVVNERRQSRGTSSPHATLQSLYFQNSLDHIKRNAESANGSYHVALAMVEEAYQDHFDEVLDAYEEALKKADVNQDPKLVAEAKVSAKTELEQLKLIRSKKLDEFARQFGVV